MTQGGDVDHPSRWRPVSRAGVSPRGPCQARSEGRWPPALWQSGQPVGLCFLLRLPVGGLSCDQAHCGPEEAVGTRVLPGLDLQRPLCPSPVWTPSVLVLSLQVSEAPRHTADNAGPDTARRPRLRGAEPRAPESWCSQQKLVAQRTLGHLLWSRIGEDRVLSHDRGVKGVSPRPREAVLDQKGNGLKTSSGWDQSRG